MKCSGVSDPGKPASPGDCAPRGVTLVELLVVITLLAILTAAVIPVMGPAIESRRVREASRMVSSYLAAARSRAFETGRPAGVMIQRFPVNGPAQSPQFSMNLAIAQSQPPYGGDLTTSMAYVSTNGYSLYVTGLGTNMTSPNPIPDYINSQRIQIGDRMRLGYMGPYYYINVSNASQQLDANQQYIINVGANAALVLSPVPPLSPPAQAYTPPPTIPQYNPQSTSGVQGAPFPYQILRQPIRSPDQPMQLPEGIVIDLQWSGMCTEPNGIFSGSSNPIISFAPGGGVDMLYDGGPQYPTGTIYLLLGQSGQVNSQPQTDPTLAQMPNNLGDMNSLWVSVNPQSGQTSVNPNYNPNFATNQGLAGFSSPATEIITARSLASGSSLLPNGSSVPVTTTGGN